MSNPHFKFSTSSPTLTCTICVNSESSFYVSCDRITVRGIDYISSAFYVLEDGKVILGIRENSGKIVSRAASAYRVDNPVVSASILAKKRCGEVLGEVLQAWLAEQPVQYAEGIHGVLLENYRRALETEEVARVAHNDASSAVKALYDALNDPEATHNKVLRKCALAGL